MNGLESEGGVAVAHHLGHSLLKLLGFPFERVFGRRPYRALVARDARFEHGVLLWAQGFVRPQMLVDLDV